MNRKSFIFAFIAAILVVYGKANVLHTNNHWTGQHGTVMSSSIRLTTMVDTMAVSKTILIHSRVKEMEENGQKVLSLAIGEPDYQPPKEIIDATVKK